MYLYMYYGKEVQCKWYYDYKMMWPNLIMFLIKPRNSIVCTSVEELCYCKIYH